MSKVGEPLLRVLRGAPDDVELAALTAVIAHLASASAVDQAEPAERAWGDPAGQLKAPARPDPAAWRASGLPR